MRYNHLKTPLRYPGGKSKAIKTLSKWYPKTCSVICCEILMKLGLADGVEPHPAKLYKKALTWRDKNADTINKWDSSVWENICS